MIDDLSHTLEAIFDDPALGVDFPELLAANVVFDRPDSTFTPQAPASLDLFLYDIRENLELRNNQPIVERQGTEAVIRKPRAASTAPTWSPPGPPAGRRWRFRSSVCWARRCRSWGAIPRSPRRTCRGRWWASRRRCR
jgi:hypothetical protein